MRHWIHNTPIEVKYSRTYKSEARASPPGLSIRMIAALYLLDSEGEAREKKTNMIGKIIYDSANTGQFKLSNSQVDKT